MEGTIEAQGVQRASLRPEPTGTILYWTGPIRSLNGQVIGVAVLGEPLSAIAGSIRSSGAADLTFYGSTGQVLVSTLSSTSALPGATLGMIQPDRPVRFNQSSGGRAYMNLLSDWTMRKMRLGYVAGPLDTPQLQAAGDP